MITTFVLRNVFLVVLVWALTACTAIPGTEIDTAATQSDKPELRIAVVGGIDFDSLHVLEAVEMLQEDGYALSIDMYDSPNLAVVALDKGEAEFSTAGVRAIWVAISKGAKIRTVMERVSSRTWAFAATTSITHCSDLEGKRIALNSTGGLNRAMLDAYVQATCPDVTFQQLIIPGDGSRVAAFLAGEIDASVVSLPDLLKLERQAPGQFHALDDFSPIVSGIIVSGLHVNADFAGQHPEAVEDFIRAMLTVNRRFHDDPAQIVVAAEKHMEIEGEDFSELAESYVSLGAWDVNGGLQPESIERSFALYHSLEALPEDADPSHYIDTSYLERVLDEIGRR